MPAALTLCPFAPAYEAQIRALSAQTQMLHQTRLPHIFTDGGAHQQDLLDVVFNPDVPHNIRAIMALQGQALAGYVLVVPDHGDHTDTPINALIADICVVPAYQRQGVGTALLAWCAAEKEAQEWESLRAQVWQGNAASHALFDAAGFGAERTDYRLGAPSVPPPASSNGVTKRWLLPLCLLLIVVAAAYLTQ